MIQRYKYVFHPAAVAALLALTTLPGCFTGIERTPSIKDRGGSKINTTVTPEQKLLADVTPEPPAQWKMGKCFILAEGRPEVAFTPSTVARLLVAGDTLRFHGFDGRIRLSGDSVTDVTLLSPGGDLLSWRIERPVSVIEASDELKLPFLIDADLVKQAKSRLEGLKVYNLRANKSGRKFSEMTILDVMPGDAEFPLKVIADTDTLPMVVNSRSASARTFSNYFSLENPRKNHSDISDKNWQLICSGKIALEMTREECRLALGSPSEVERTAAYNGIIERWSYENGAILYFTDGLLTRFRE